MNKKFIDWWEVYIKKEDCPLKATPWSHFEIGLIKEAMEDAFLYKEKEKRIAPADVDPERPPRWLKV